MQKEESNRRSKVSRFSRSSRASRLSDLCSLQKFTVRNPSLGKKASFVEAMDIETPYGQMGSEFMSDAECRFSDKRESNGLHPEEYSFIPSINQNDFSRKSTYKVTHECNCDQQDCMGVHCNCFLTPREICVIGSCCPNCIKEKNEFLMATRGWQLEKVKKLEDVRLDEQFLGLLKQKNVKNMHYLKQVYAKEPTMQNLIFCTCKKSHCQKKYCLCFDKGVECGQYCGCVECGNTEKSYKMDEREEKSRWERYANYCQEEQEKESPIDPDIDKFMEEQLREQNFEQTMEFQPPNFQGIDGKKSQN